MPPPLLSALARRFRQSQVVEGVPGDPRHLLVNRERVWANAIHPNQGLSPEQAVGDAIARSKQILRDQLRHADAAILGWAWECESRSVQVSSG
jgi:hypothetical protein